MSSGNNASEDCPIHQNIIGSNNGFSQWIRIYIGCTLLESQWAEQTPLFQEVSLLVCKQDSIVSFLSLQLAS